MADDPISEAQRQALRKLRPALPADYYLAGGVAVAAHLGHRSSRDLDLFAASDPTALRPSIETIDGLVVQSQSAGTLYLRIDGIPISLIQYRYPLLDAPGPLAGLDVPVASITDLACMKLSAISGRGAARDFWDLHAIIVATHRGLDAYLAAYRLKFPVEDLGHVIRSLVYFADAETQPLPDGLAPTSWASIRTDFETWVRPLLIE
ncbi:MAG: nucleotidyl transferase AbiEii/AbiGii toxin family protein [Deltaproteobacteria bacterium]|nr:nucleotidyl transferase AbiEii/AbiGii toxin family protein [Deltaproteobacteria bacterium]